VTCGERGEGESGDGVLQSGSCRKGYYLDLCAVEELMQERRVSVDISIVRSISMATPLTFSFCASHKFLLDQLLVPNESDGGWSIVGAINQVLRLS
jgi:hypothetical protein